MGEVGHMMRCDAIRYESNTIPYDMIRYKYITIQYDKIRFSFSLLLGFLFFAVVFCDFRATVLKPPQFSGSIRSQAEVSSGKTLGLLDKTRNA